MKNITVNLNSFFLTPTELNTRNITDIPVERMYYFVNCTKQICIHKVQSKYCIYTMNWIPQFYLDKHIYDYQPNHWQKIVSYTKIDDAIRIFRKCVLEIIGENNKKLTLEDVIKYLTDLKAISEGVN